MDNFYWSQMNIDSAGVKHTSLYKEGCTAPFKVIVENPQFEQNFREVFGVAM